MQAANDFDQGHHRHRVEEVHANKALRLADRRPQLCDRQRRGVGGDHAVAADAGSDLLEDAQFELEVFGGGLDHQLRLLQLGVVGAGADARHRGFGSFGGQGLFADLTLQVLAQGGQAALQRGVGHIDQSDLVTGHCTHLGNAVAHGACADYGNVLNTHLENSWVQTRSKTTAMPWPPPMHMVASA
ncbi:hypothetical protein D9M71_434000 [compost metagenome]